MYKKYFLIAGFVLVITGLLIHVSHANNLPEIRFEQTCPDSNGYAPEFIYEDFNSPYLQELRTRFNLDDIVKDCASEYDKVLAVMNWVHHLWRHDSDNEPIKSDPISILEEVFEHQRNFRCTEYSVVLAGCLNALGLRSRALSLMTSDVETRQRDAGHLLTEVYLPSLGKWILADAQFNLQPVLDSVPLNAIELQEALRVQRSKIKFASVDPDQTSGKYTTAEIENYYQDFIIFIGQYLYYFRAPIDQRYIPFEMRKQAGSVVLVPLGSKAPTIFQIKYPLGNLVGTHSAACFYQKIKERALKIYFKCCCAFWHTAPCHPTCQIQYYF